MIIIPPSKSSPPQTSSSSSSISSTSSVSTIICERDNNSILMKQKQNTEKFITKKNLKKIEISKKVDAIESTSIILPPSSAVTEEEIILTEEEEEVKTKLPSSYVTLENSFDDADDDETLNNLNNNNLRQRKGVVYNFTNRIIDNNKIIDNTSEKNCESKFPCVQNLVQMYANMIQQKKKINCGENQQNQEDQQHQHKQHQHQRNRISISDERRSPISDEGCLTPRSVYYSSDDDDDEHDRNNLKKREKVARSSSSDSALGLDDDFVVSQNSSNSTKSSSSSSSRKRRSTLTVTDIPLRAALLPLAEPTRLSSCESLSPTSIGLTFIEQLSQVPVRSKMLLEAQVIEIPANDFDLTNLNISRRESSQSNSSDLNYDDLRKVRYMRTPSVVVSDYSDENLCGGITLEEIEYFQKHRTLRRVSYDDDLSDMSGASSCSNLNYCGSHISALDGSGCFDMSGSGLRTPERKISNCSTCSTVSGCDDDENFTEQFEEALRLNQKKKVSSLD